MGSLLEQIGDWIKQGLIDAIMTQFSGLFNIVNEQIGDIAVNVGRTPGDWNPGIFSMIRTLSETAVIPIAGMILTFVMCYELIQMIIDRNNMHDVDTWIFFKWFFKTFIAVYILTHTFDIVMAAFDVAQHVVNQSAGLITGTLDLTATLPDIQTRLEAMSVWGLMGLWLEISIVALCLQIMSVCIFIVVFGRMIEIYLTVSVAPIPFSTMTNREWGQMGNNYLKSLFAVAFQGFLIMVCVAIYAVLVQSISTASSVHGAIWGTAGYTALLCFSLFKTGSLSKSIFSAH